jgi:hypothetical protein
MKYVVLLITLLFLSGCSVTTLRCGVTETDSYVDLVNVPQDLAANSRYLADLCGFAYDQEN